MSDSGHLFEGHPVNIGWPAQSESVLVEASVNPYGSLVSELTAARENPDNPEKYMNAMRQLLINIKADATENPETGDNELINSLSAWSNAIPYPSDEFLRQLKTPNNQIVTSNVYDGAEMGGHLVGLTAREIGEIKFADTIIAKLNQWVQLRAGDHLRVESAPRSTSSLVPVSIQQARTIIRSISGI